MRFSLSFTLRERFRAKEAGEAVAENTLKVEALSLSLSLKLREQCRPKKQEKRWQKHELGNCSE